MCVSYSSLWRIHTVNCQCFIVALWNCCNHYSHKVLCCCFLHPNAETKGHTRRHFTAPPCRPAHRNSWAPRTSPPQICFTHINACTSSLSYINTCRATSWLVTLALVLASWLSPTSSAWKQLLRYYFGCMTLTSSVYFFFIFWQKKT